MDIMVGPSVTSLFAPAAPTSGCHCVWLGDGMICYLDAQPKQALQSVKRRVSGLLGR
jgi:hypothetical protein